MANPIESVPVLHVRLSGQPGVRVTQQGILQTRKAVKGQEDHDHKLIPRAVLAEIEAICQGDRPLSAAEGLHAIRDHLAPWL